jgi:hypothetical protein
MLRHYKNEICKHEYTEHIVHVAAIKIFKTYFFIHNVRINRKYVK